MSDRHPLDPLDAAELARAVAIARDAPGLSDQVAVVSVEAREPEKADYLAWKSSGAGTCRVKRSSCCSTTAGGEAWKPSCRSTTIASSRAPTSPRASSRPCTATSS